MKRKIETELTVVIIGNEYLDLEDFAGDLYADYGINALISTNLPFAKQMVKGIDNAVENLLFIHLTMPTEKLANKIAEEYQIPYNDALSIADDITFTEQIIDFDDSTPDDLRVITYTGESGIALDHFLDVCADIIEGNSGSWFKTSKVLPKQFAFGDGIEQIKLNFDEGEDDVDKRS